MLMQLILKFLSGNECSFTAGIINYCLNSFLDKTAIKQYIVTSYKSKNRGEKQMERHDS
jgi:hypothetical protein